MRNEPANRCRRPPDQGTVRVRADGGTTTPGQISFLCTVLIALVQVAVWGFYAPIHRLHHHSVASSAKPKSNCKSHCCAHHHSESRPANSNDPQEQCPDDDQHCGLCLIAVQAGSPVDVVRLLSDLARVERYVGQAIPFVERERLSLFDSRGPPA